MKRTYQVVTKPSTLSSRELAEFLSKDGQLLLPLVNDVRVLRRAAQCLGRLPGTDPPVLPATAPSGPAMWRRLSPPRRSSGPRPEDGGADARITHREAEALVQLARGSATAATQLMDEAIEIAEGQRPPNGPASPIKPPYQLYEEILLELNRPADALERFETSLLRMPQRARSLLGAARAATKSGDRLTAREHYAALTAIWRDYRHLPGFIEAQRFVEDTP